MLSVESSTVLSESENGRSSSQPLKKVGKFVLATTLFALALGALLVQYFSHVLPMELLFNSDNLYLHALIVNLFEEGGRLSHWILCPNAYYFPGLLISFIDYLFSHSIYGAFAIHIVLQSCLLFVSLFFLFRAFNLKNSLALATLCVTFLLYLAVAVPQSALNGNNAWNAVIQDGEHFGTFLGVLWVLTLLQVRPFRGPIYGGVGILCFLLALSDPLFLGWFTFPYIAASVILGEALYMPACVLVASFLGRVVFTLTAAYPQYHNMTLKLDAHIVDRLGLISHLIEEDFIAHPFAVTFVFVFYIISGVVLCRAVLGYATLNRQRLGLLSFGVVSAVFLLLAHLSLEHITPSHRYFVLFFTLPLIGGIMALGRLGPVRLYTLTLGVLCLLGLDTYSKGVALQSDFYPQDIACIDKAASTFNLTTGVAAYWDARHIQMLSKQKLHLAPYTPDLHPYLWITTQDLFKKTYDFALIHPQAEPHLNERAISQAPNTIVTCGPYRLLIYEPKGLKLF